MDEKNTDISHASSAVDFSSVRKIKPPRLLCAFSLGVLYLALAALCWAGARLGGAFSDVEGAKTPLATDLLLHLTRFLQTKLGMITAGLAFLCVFLLVIRGALDKILKILIIVNAIVVAGLVVWAFAGFLLPLYDLIPSLKKP